MKKHLTVFLLTVVLSFFPALFLVGCTSEEQTLLTVDMYKLSRYSIPGTEASKHMEQVEGLLVNAYNSVEQEYKDADAATKEATLQHALTTIKEYIASERTSTEKALEGLIRESAEQIRRKHQASYIVQKEMFLATSPSYDVTDEVLEELNTQKIFFKPLPNITIKKFEEKPAEPKKK